MINSNHITSIENNELLYFPFTPYPQQKLLITKIISFLKDDSTKIGFFESPTGTGKSLCLLSSCLYYLKNIENSEDCHIVEHDKKESNTLVSIENNLDNEEISWLLEFGKRKIESKVEIIKEKRLLTTKINPSNTKIEEMKRKVLESNNKISNLIKKSENENEKDELLLKDNLKEKLTLLEKEVSNQEKPFKKVQILYLTRTHTQISQVIKEFKVIKLKNEQKKRR